jgi:hypothetical protein
MLTANWGWDENQKKLPAMDGTVYGELDLSIRVVNALRGNYHNWKAGHWDMEYPPVSWLEGMRYGVRRKLHYIGPKALREIEAVCPSWDRERFDG